MKNGVCVLNRADPWLVSDIILSVVGRVTGNVITVEEMSLSDA